MVHGCLRKRSSFGRCCGNSATRIRWPNPRHTRLASSESRPNSSVSSLQTHRAHQRSIVASCTEADRSPCLFRRYLCCILSPIRDCAVLRVASVITRTGHLSLASLPIPSQVPLGAISSHRIAAIVSENSTRTRHDMYVDGMLLAHVAPARPPRDVENIKWLPTTPLPDCSSHSSSRGYGLYCVPSSQSPAISRRVAVS
ncbi:hypothetical protein HBI56_009200 [Parastagonospora nodorum]|nr:hypothetical protein HBI10_096130 [Parastagonospora nodorum]KAH4033360.1 hypothetical protein HBI13_009620 [Parastagonospora nodorum]KAH4042167.1 hypothetical protein HBI09_009560 [Parastagonospora nodorum]KAH4060666.1 hypothetical protein HBH49_005060 [Parastagonospora nodorum]KAH4352759.1 hypothetical protein HBH98_025350 [Parastagonospora nodorum]